MSSKRNNIELFGLPGSGKSTYAKWLKKNEEVFLPEKTKTCGWVIRYVRKNPLKSLRILCLFLTQVPTLIKHKALRMTVSVWLQTISEFGSVINPNKTVLYEEGWLQRLLSLYQEEKSVEYFVTVLRWILPKETEIRVLQYAGSLFVRYKDDHPRRAQGNAAFSIWKHTLQSNMCAILTALQRSGYTVVYIDDSYCV